MKGPQECNEASLPGLRVNSESITQPTVQPGPAKETLLINLHISPRSLHVLLNYCKWADGSHTAGLNALLNRCSVKVRSRSERLRHRSFRHLLPGSNKSRPVCRLPPQTKHSEGRLETSRGRVFHDQPLCNSAKPIWPPAHCEECF